MGSHSWFEECPHCGFESVLVSSYNNVYFDVNCPICGYARWTEEKVPDPEDIELARQAIGVMSAEEIEEAIDSYYESELPLVTRLKGTP